jgi:hypothetical protein
LPREKFVGPEGSDPGRCFSEISPEVVSQGFKEVFDGGGDLSLFGPKFAWPGL